MNDRHPLPGPKTSAAGLLHRTELVRREFPDATEMIANWGHATKIGLVDLLDAAAAAWSALRWATGQVTKNDILGRIDGRTPHNAAGLPMRIVV
jgi:hypothetical protein